MMSLCLLIVSSTVFHSTLHTVKYFVFYKYHDLSAKDHERQRRGGEGTTDYNLTLTSPLPKRDSIMKCKHNKSSI